MSDSGYGGGRFKAALLHYALGRGVNALASVALFVLLARALAVPDYGAYVTLWALLELLLALGNLGSEWVTATEVPRLRQAQAWGLLRRLLAAVLGTQLLCFGLLGLLLALAGAPLAALLGYEALPAAVWPWLGLHLLAEGLGRSLRDQILSSLLLQWLAQAVQLLRNLLVLGGVAWWMRAGSVQLVELVRLETLASGFSMLIALANLGWQLRHRGEPVQTVVAPDPAQLRRMAWNAWLGTLGQLLTGPQLLLLLAARFLSVELTALLGFARNLAEQLRRFMPIEFGFAILRTYLVAAHAQQPSSRLLVQRSQIAWKLNTLVLLPVWLLALLWGGELAVLVGGAKFASAGPLLAAWASWVLIWSHHRLSDTWAHLLQRSAAVGRTSLLLAALPLLLAWVLAQQQALAAVLLLAAAEAVYVVSVGALALSGAGLRYPWRSLKLPVLGGVALLALGLGFYLRTLPMHWLAGALAVTGSFWLLSWLLTAVGRADAMRWRSGGD